MKARLAAVAAVILFTLFVAPFLFSCGPFFPNAVFTFTADPDYPRDQFVAGKLGILKGTWRTTELVVAYRYLAGKSFTPDEQKAILALWVARDRPWDAPKPAGPTALEQWKQARLSVPGAADIEIAQEASTGDYSTYVNCSDSAFTTATATLRERAQQFGMSSPEMKDWLAGQDTVFTNCAHPGAGMPASVPAMLKNAVLHEDRAYQTAAAQLYAGQFDPAVAAFDAIARDAASPWHTMAPYLAARAVVRKATLTKITPKDDQPVPSFDAAVLKDAVPRLQAIAADPKLASTHDMAERELEFINYRIAPDQALQQRARDLLAPRIGPAVTSALWDYSHLLLGTAPQQAPDDMTDWIRTMQAGYTQDQYDQPASDPKARAAAAQHAYERWQKTKSVPWLAAALSQYPDGMPVPADLTTAGENVAVSSPAYLTSFYGAMHARANAGDMAAVRHALDVFLPANASLPDSAKNAFLHLRFTAATDLAEFLRYASRQEAGETFAYEDEASPAKAKPESMLDDDAGSILNTGMPLAMLSQVIAGHALPPRVQRDLVLSTWTRAALLDRADLAQSLAAEVNQAAPELKINTAMYAAAHDAAARRFALILALGHFPGLRPYIVAGLARSEKLDTIDSYRDNWWCPIGYPGYQHLYSAMFGEDQAKRVPQVFAPFEAPADQTAATAEWKLLEALPTGPNYLLQQALAWAKAHPDDPNVPEALHFAVRASRYGCSDKATGALSKEAHALLHSRYPASAWTKKTPYWYGQP